MYDLIINVHRVGVIKSFFSDGGHMIKKVWRPLVYGKRHHVFQLFPTSPVLSPAPSHLFSCSSAQSESPTQLQVSEYAVASLRALVSAILSTLEFLFLCLVNLYLCKQFPVFDGQCGSVFPRALPPPSPISVTAFTSLMPLCLVSTLRAEIVSYTFVYQCL